MLCPSCRREGVQSSLEVRDTRKDPTSLRVRRRRVCPRNLRHVFDTVEQPARVPLEGVLVRGRHADHRRLQPFSRYRLMTDISTGVLKQLGTDEVTSIVDDVCSMLEERLQEYLTPLRETERSALAEPAEGAIDVAKISELVENRLRTASDKVAHMRFALASRGRVNITPGEGFLSARDLLKWAYDAYPQYAEELPPTALRAEDRWWPPSRPVPEPTTVIKRDGVQRFSRSQFEESVAKALFGRPQPRRFAILTVDWVLSGLVGQEAVLSFQLAAGVMDCLRRVDDIAYLRYASIAKNFTSVREFLVEARGLVTQPSPALIFDRAAPRGDATATQLSRLLGTGDQVVEALRRLTATAPLPSPDPGDGKAAT